MSHKTPKLLLSLTIVLSMYVSFYFFPKNKITVFIALQTFVWHFIAYLFCSSLSSYKFKNPNAKYIQIKNKYFRKILIHKFPVFYGYISKYENKANIIGFVLNIINISIFVIFEILLIVPKIYCDPYEYTIIISKRVGSRSINLTLYSINEIIAAESSRVFALLIGLTYIVFVILYDRNRKRVSRNNRRFNNKKSINLSSKEINDILKTSESNYNLYSSLREISVKQNNKKHKFWYNKNQMTEIENLVNLSKESVELEIVKVKEKPVSFSAIDTTDNRVIFKGYFI